MSEIHEAFREIVEAQLARHSTRHSEYHREFAIERPREGAKALAYLLARYPEVFGPATRVLDVGGGNGGFLLPFAQQGCHCFWIDRTHSTELSELMRRTDVRVLRTLSDASAVPLESESIDVVLYVETIEHVAAEAVGREIVRVLRPGGICYITTPARLRFLFRRDPHYGIPGLLLLPDSIQRRVFGLLRSNEEYEVEHLFWSAWGIVRTLPGLRVSEVTSKNWAGVLRRFDWDWLVVKKD